ncbi:putative signal peptide protein [Puccinia sorghi]|uniref:Putative signal peptide protein n=1 Tax=Puccinia sorghi TaxID=27349 RepID=A0A0L6V6W9_9BASI|nr:putative signal peptide protein [Puccinia sorghi]
MILKSWWLTAYIYIYIITDTGKYPSFVTHHWCC